MAAATTASARPIMPLAPPPSAPTHIVPATSRMGRMGATVQNPGAALNSASNNNSIPLSARKAVGLDLSSVERRGQTANVVGPKPSRPLGLHEGPTFRPTEDEFRAGPIEYIKKIAAEGQKYGIAKIVPPPGWNPPFAIDTEVCILINITIKANCNLALSFSNSKTRAQSNRWRHSSKLELPRSAG